MTDTTFYTVRFFENAELVNIVHASQAELANIAVVIEEYSAHNRSISIELSHPFDTFEMTYSNALKMLSKFIVAHNFPMRIKVDVRLRTALNWDDEIIVQMCKVEIEYCNIQKIGKTIVVG